MKALNLFIIGGIVLMGTFFIPTANACAYAGGDGGGCTPYQITTCADFADMALNPTSYYVLENDIDCTTMGNAVGGGMSLFTGSLNGDGHKLTIAIATTENDGAPIAPWLSFSGDLRNLWIDGTVTDTYGDNILPGLIYVVQSGTITNVKSTLTITGTTGSAAAGGIASYMGGGTITDSYFNGTIDIGGYGAGGLIGVMSGGTIQNSYSVGSITAGSNAGGLVSGISNLDNPSSIIDSFSAAEINGTFAGGAIGHYQSGTITQVLWDKFASGQNDCANNGAVTNCSGINTGNSQPGFLLGNVLNPPMSEWDFLDTWITVTDDYPELRVFQHDIETEGPVLSIEAQEHGDTFLTTDTMHFIFTLPEPMHTGTLALTLTPVQGNPIIIHLRDANAIVENPFDINLRHVGNTYEVTSTTAEVIPAGTYTFAISYQDEAENPTADAAIPNITIARPVVHHSASGSVIVRDQVIAPVVVPEPQPVIDTHIGFTYTRDLHVGMQGDDIKNLQSFLIDQNKGPVAQALAKVGATGFFGNLTRAALAEFQKAVGIIPAKGYFGPKTKAFIKSLS